MAETNKASTTKMPRATTAKAAVAREPVTAKKPTRGKVTQMKASHEDIARLAHRYWAERGHKHGSDADDWLRAEQELRGKAS
jgi:hypothetical protein